MKRRIAENEIDEVSFVSTKTMSPFEAGIFPAIWKIRFEVSFRAFDGNLRLISKNKFRIGMNHLGRDPDNSVSTAEIQYCFESPLGNMFEQESCSDIELLTTEEIGVID